MLIAVDTGGTKTLVAGFSNTGTITASTKFATPKNQGVYLKAVKKSILEVADGEPVDSIVLALPGVIKDGVALWCHNLGWYKFPIQQMLGDMFPGVPTRIENDANLAGLGSTRLLDPVPSSSLYVTFSTGVGTSVITNGKLNPGFLNSEGGHAVIKHEGEFKFWEKISSGKRLYETYGKYARDITDDKTWRDVAYRMSLGLLVLVPFMQPDTVIIGGSMGSYFDRYGHHLKEILDNQLISDIIRPNIIAATHPEEAVVYGCYFYALDELTPVSATA